MDVCVLGGCVCACAHACVHMVLWWSAHFCDCMSACARLDPRTSSRALHSCFWDRASHWPELILYVRCQAREGSVRLLSERDLSTGHHSWLLSFDWVTGMELRVSCPQSKQLTEWASSLVLVADSFDLARSQTLTWLQVCHGTVKAATGGIYTNVQDGCVLYKPTVSNTKSV